MVNLSHDRLDVFPEWGLYPAQAEKVRGTFFPHTSQVNLRQVRDLIKIDSTFRGFIIVGVLVFTLAMPPLCLIRVSMKKNDVSIC